MHSDNPLFLSQSVDGAPIVIAATATPGTLITSSIKGGESGVVDQVFLWACNNDSVSRDLVIQLGGTSSSHELTVSLPAKTITKILDGAFLNNNKNVRAYCATANVVSVWGYIDRWTRPNRVGN